MLDAENGTDELTWVDVADKISGTEFECTPNNVLLSEPVISTLEVPREDENLTAPF
tara:strand:- start:16 stop:183 length:168 start_codon:yes stop_codon:yes gene_type:complete